MAASEGLRDEQLDGILERDGGSEVGWSEEPVEVRVLVREIRSLRAALAASAAERASLREGLEQIAGMGRHSHLLSEPGNCACTADMALAALAVAPPICEENMPDDQPVPVPSSLGSPERSRTGRDGSGQAGRLPPRLALGASSADRLQEHAWHAINYWRWPLWKCQRCKMQTKRLAAAAAIACQPTRLGYCRVCQVKAPTPSSVYCRLHRAESGKQRRKQRALSDAEMVALRDQGVTFKSIAERLEVSIPRARQLVREARAGLAGGQP